MKPLSFIIITYNRSADLLELLRNIRKLNKADELLEEVIVVNNASTESYWEVENYISSQNDFPFRYYQAGSNLGVARGRNFGIQKGRAPVIIMLDDDAVMGNNDCLVNLLEELDKGTGARPTAILSFKVVYYDTGRMQENALPHKRYNEYRDKAGFETYYYAGGAHAIRRPVIEELGYYPDDFFYGMEEYDLAYRVLDAGYSIRYTNRVIMRHKESPEGRPAVNAKLQMMWVNKAKVAYRYLPVQYYYSTAFLWSFHYLLKTRFDLKGFLEGWKKIRSIPGKEQKRKIRSSTLQYLHQVKARLWY